MKLLLRPPFLFLTPLRALISSLRQQTHQQCFWGLFAQRCADHRHFLSPLQSQASRPLQLLPPLSQMQLLSWVIPRVMEMVNRQPKLGSREVQTHDRGSRRDLSHASLARNGPTR